MSRAHKSRGNAILEFTLVGIPLMFVLISIFEVSRGMWIYHTLNNAVREGTRYAIVHGKDCYTPPNDCAVTAEDVAERIEQMGVGLIPDDLQLTFAINASADPDPGDLNDEDVITGTLAALAGDPSVSGDGNTSPWPDANTFPLAAKGSGDVEIRATYSFRSAIALFWPGSAPVSFGTVNLPARSRERIQF